MKFTLEQLKQIKIQQVVYPVIVVIAFGIVLVCFIQTARFLSREINRPFSVADMITNEDLLTVDKVGFEMATKRLEGVSSDADGAESDVPAADSAASENKDVLKIAVYNTVQVSGVATELKDALEIVGFKNITTADKTRQGLTTVAIKQFVKDTYPVSVLSLQQIVAAKYPLVQTAVLPSSEVYDIIITIGGAVITTPPTADETDSAP